MVLDIPGSTRLGTVEEIWSGGLKKRGTNDLSSL